MRRLLSILNFVVFNLSNSYPSLFVKVKASLSSAILLYVDDMILTRDDIAKIIRFQEDLFICFEIKSLGEAHFFLGLELKRSNGYLLSQIGYATKVFKRFSMENSNATTSPMDSGLKLQKDEEEHLNDVT